MTGADSRIYLDYAATTPLRPEALAAMTPYFAQHGFNPSSLHAEGRRARAALDDARDAVARVLGCRSQRGRLHGKRLGIRRVGVAGLRAR